MNHPLFCLLVGGLCVLPLSRPAPAAAAARSASSRSLKRSIQTRYVNGNRVTTVTTVETVVDELPGNRPGTKRLRTTTTTTTRIVTLTVKGVRSVSTSSTTSIQTATVRGRTTAQPPPGSTGHPVRAPAPQPHSNPASGLISRTEIAGILRVHNQARRLVGVKALTWDRGIARYAQAWANRLATYYRGLHHRPRSGAWRQRYGENLASAGAGRPSGLYGAEGSRQWYGEKRHYRLGRVGTVRVGGVTGHYTQMVWRKSTKIGCGIARYRSGRWYNTVLVCNYSPAGNMTGEKPY